jgi:hypothetical protein
VVRIGLTTESKSLFKKRQAEEGSNRTFCSLESSVKIHSRFTPVLLPIPDLTYAHSLTLVQEELFIGSMRPSLTVQLHLTLSLSPRIGLFKQGLFDEYDGVAMGG